MRKTYDRIVTRAQLPKGTSSNACQTELLVAIAVVEDFTADIRSLDIIKPPPKKEEKTVALKPEEVKPEEPKDEDTLAREEARKAPPADFVNAHNKFMSKHGDRPQPLDLRASEMLGRKLDQKDPFALAKTLPDLEVVMARWLAFQERAMGLRVAAVLKAKDEGGKAVLRLTPTPEFLKTDAKTREGMVAGLRSFWAIRCADAKLSQQPLVEMEQ